MLRAALHPRLLAAPLAALCLALAGCEYVWEMAKGDIKLPRRVDFEPKMVGRLTLNEGFTIQVWAQGLGNARNLAFAPDGTAYVARRNEADVLMLKDKDGDGRAEAPVVVVSGLDGANDVLVAGDRLLVAATSQVVSADRRADGTLATPRPLLTGLPGGGRHPNRTLGIGPDGRLYVSVGSSSNAEAESNPEHAAMLRAPLSGGARTVYAKGLRNTIGFDWHPTTGALWGMDHGADGRGPNTPPEELNELVENGDYGWPYCYGDRVPDADVGAPPGGTHAAFCAGTRAPALNYQAHSAPLDFLFYRGTQFPEAYRADAFVTMHGSWNRAVPVGYKVVRVRYENGRPTGFEDFVTGFLSSDGQTQFGRPCGLAIAPDGALFFTDDSNGVIYRVAHAPAR